MKKIKAMTQKIWKISILYPKTYPISQYSLENTYVGGISFLIKMSFNKRPTTLSKRDSNAGVFLVILPNF